MSHQDWNTIVVHKPKYLQDKNEKEKEKEKQQIDRVPKEIKKAKKAENEEGDFRQDKIGRKFSVALQQARLQKGWKQEQLAHALNVNKNVINQYESGKAIPHSSLIAKMNRALGVTLPSINKVEKN
jgi:putative transcription factor